MSILCRNDEGGRLAGQVDAQSARRRRRKIMFWSISSASGDDDDRRQWLTRSPAITECRVSGRSAHGPWSARLLAAETGNSCALRSVARSAWLARCSACVNSATRQRPVIDVAILSARRARASVMNNSHVAKRTAWRPSHARLNLAAARETYTWFLSCHLSICRQSSCVCVCAWTRQAKPRSHYHQSTSTPQIYNKLFSQSLVYHENMLSPVQSNVPVQPASLHCSRHSLSGRYVLWLDSHA